MNYTDPDADIKFYYGYGPGINLGYDRDEQEQTESTSISKMTRYGVSGLTYAGVEWFFQPSMSLHAEYGASFQVNHMRNKRTLEQDGTENINANNTTSISLGGDGVRFGLSVYF